MNRKVIAICLLCAVILVAGCAKQTVETTTPSISSTAPTLFIPPTGSVSLKAGQDILEKTDKFIKVVKDLNGLESVDAPQDKKDAMRSSGKQLLSLYIESFDLTSKLLSEQAIIDKAKSKDERVEAYTKLIGTYAEAISSQAKIDSMSIDFSKVDCNELSRLRNDLAKHVGK